MKEIYLDHSATTPLLPCAARAVAEAMSENWYNPSALYAPAVRAAGHLKEARRTLARALGAREDEIFFHSGGTEGVNTAIYGALGKRIGKSEMIISGVEHAAGHRAAQAAEAMGARVTWIAPEADGTISPSAVADAVTEETRLVSVMHVNNETGALNDIAAIARAVKSVNPRTIVHSDGVQAFMRIPFSVASSGVDIYTVSGHKIGAPRGIGATYLRKGTPFVPTLIGGGQESDLRSGTENAAGAAGLAAAAEHWAATVGERLEKQETIRTRMIAALSDLPDLMIHACGPHSPYILSISARGVRGETVLHLLEAEGILIGTGSACHSRHKGSRVLQQMGVPAEYMEGTVRLSFPLAADFEDFDTVIAAYREAIEKLRHFGRK